MAKQILFLCLSALVSQISIAKTFVCDKEIIVVGAGMSGLAAASILKEKGCSVKVIEARDRIGGRVYTQEMNYQDSNGEQKTMKVDFGASWIHGIGPGTSSGEKHLPDYKSRYSPLYEIAKKNGINLTVSWKDEEDCTSYHYWWQGGELPSTYNLDKMEDKMLKYFYKKQKKANISTSVGDILKDAPFYTQATEEEKNVWLYLESYEWEADYAIQIEDLSAKYLDYDYEYKGANVLLNDGYSQFPQILSNGLDISLSSPVTKITYSNMSSTSGKIQVQTSDSTVYEGDYVIVTIPLALLKQNTIEFIPSLPEYKQDVINRFGAGVMDKLYLSFDKVFWPEDADWLEYVSDQGKGYWIEALNLYKYYKVPILLFFNTGDVAKSLGQLSDNEIVQQALSVLTTMFGQNNMGNLISFKRTNWSNDQYAQMSYSHIAPNQTWSKDCSNIKKSINNQIFFAGEHTYCTVIGSATGAYISGDLAAQGILKLIK